MYFESHAHYDDRRFKNDQQEIIQKLKDEKISHVINIGADIKSSSSSIDLGKKYDFFYATVGVHPHYAKNLNEDNFNELKKLALKEKVVGIGEIGLDFYRDLSPRDVQRYWFLKQLDLAKELDLPVVIHSRDADGEVFDIMKDYDNPRKGIIHAYAGSKELGIEYVKRGYYLGVGGVITFKNARKLLESVEAVPLENIVIETDSPYLSPEPFRGERNDSTHLKYVVKKIAELKNTTEEEVAKITKENGLRLFYKI